MDRQQVTLLVLLDLSVAFDTIDHATRRLKTSFGIEGKALEWFLSYLSNRSQRVVFGDGLSDGLHLPCGVPQGSCLGPLLFTMYASKLFQVIKEHLPSAHADDSQLYGCVKAEFLIIGSRQQLEKVHIGLSETLTFFLCQMPRI